MRPEEQQRLTSFEASHQSFGAFLSSLIVFFFWGGGEAKDLQTDAEEQKNIQSLETEIDEAVRSFRQN